MEYLFVAFSEDRNYTIPKTKEKWFNHYEEKGSNVGRQYIIYLFSQFYSILIALLD